MKIYNNQMELYIFFIALGFLVVYLLLFKGGLHFLSTFSYNKNKRIKEANALLTSLWNVKPDQLVYKEDKQLKNLFPTKGQLHYQVFAPNGEYYVQFEFEGNEAVDCRIKKQSTLNVIDHTRLEMHTI